MKTAILIIVLAAILIACSFPSQSETTIQTAIAQTLIAQRQNATATTELIFDPTATSTINPVQATSKAMFTISAVQATVLKAQPRKTATPRPTATQEQSLDELRKEIFVDTAELIESFDDVESVGLIRGENGVLEIELKTAWASQDRQPDVSYQIVQLMAQILGDLETGKIFNLVGGNSFIFHLTTYSTDGDYRYQSDTDLDTIRDIYDLAISYEEWLAASDAGFR